jgi:hypothetical protein
VVELATGNLAVLPDEWVNGLFGRFAPTSVYGRVSQCALSHRSPVFEVVR